MKKSSWVVVGSLLIAAPSHAEGTASLGEAHEVGLKIGEQASLGAEANFTGVALFRDSASAKDAAPSEHRAPLSVVQVRTGYESDDYSSMSLDELESELDDTSLGGSIVMLGVGGGVALIGGLYALSFLLTKSACDSNSYGTFDDDGCDSFGTAGTVLAVGAVGGALLAAGGGILLGSTIGKRNKLKREIRSRGGEAQLASGTWAVAPMFGQDGAGLGVVGSF